MGATGLWDPRRGLRRIRNQGRLLHWNVDLLLFIHAGFGCSLDNRSVVAVTHRFPEGDPLEHPVRGIRARMWKRPAYRSVLPPGWRFRLLPSPGHDQASALPGSPDLGRDEADLA